MTQRRCSHNQNPTRCNQCRPSLQERAGNAFLAAQLSGLPVLEGEVAAQQAAVVVRERFVGCLSDSRAFSAQLASLPAHYRPLLRADQTFLTSLSQELLSIAERGSA